MILGNGFGAKMRAAFLADLKKSKTITLASWRQRPWRDRGKERLARLWEYWL